MTLIVIIIIIRVDLKEYTFWDAQTAFAPNARNGPVQLAGQNADIFSVDI